MKNNSIIITVLVAIIVGGAGFFGGMQYQKSQTPTFGGAQGTGMMRQYVQNGQNGNRAFGSRTGFTPVSGEIVAADANSITVKMQDGSSKIVNISSSTTINKTDTATASDLKTGTKVAAFGTTGSDGSVDAQTIQINPATGMMRNGGAPNTQSTPSAK